MAETTEFNPSKVPTDYPICINRQCPLAATCLRQLVEQNCNDSSEYWYIISPKRLAALQGSCPYYRSSTKVKYAKGLANMLENMPHKQMRAVVAGLKQLFSERTYYRIRKGERLLFPAEQQSIYKLLQACGVKARPEFDGYTEDYEW